MTATNIAPCLWLDDQAEGAAAFYAKTFPGGRVLATSHYPSSGDNPSKKVPGSVLTIDIELAGTHFSLLNGGPQFKINPTISFFAYFPRADDVERTFNALADGGNVLMGLGSYPWSAAYGWVADRYGVSWQVMLSEGASSPSIAPALMFSDARHGRAEEAMRFYCESFADGHIDQIERYEANEGPVGTVKHGRFTISGQAMVAMDSNAKHNLAFNEGVSLQVLCENQSEIDRFWQRLSDGGEQGPCGWLKDRFGVSWQIVPRDVAKWLTSGDVAARDRAFGAVMKMKKLDMHAIEAAFRG